MYEDRKKSMEGGPPTTEQILRGVNALYNSPDLQEKDKASVWLTDFQKSVSTTFSSPLRVTEKVATSYCDFFCCRSIRGKLLINCYVRNMTFIRAILRHKRCEIRSRIRFMSCLRQRTNPCATPCWSTFDISPTTQNKLS